MASKITSQLAQDSFDAFQAFINIFDPGAKVPVITSASQEAKDLFRRSNRGERDLCWSDGMPFDVIRDMDEFNPSVDLKPVHTISKEAWRLFHRYKKLKAIGIDRPILNFADGRHFHPGKNVASKIYSPSQVQGHLDGREVGYYTSGTKGFGLLYLDVDAHLPWQNDEYDALSVLKTLFPQDYGRCSKRGQNLYLKVDYRGCSRNLKAIREYAVPEFNRLAIELQSVLGQLFVQRQLLCDIEVKGSITTLQKSGTLAKLPFQNPAPCKRKDDNDRWNYESLEQFQEAPLWKIQDLKRLVQTLRKMDPQAVEVGSHKRNRLARAHEEARRAQAKQKRQEELEYRLSRRNKLRAQSEVQPASSRTAPCGGGLVQTKPTTSQDEVRSIQQALSLGNVSPAKPVSPTGVWDSEEPCAFTRHHRVLQAYVRHFWKLNGRLPNTDESLAYLKDNHFFSGDWDENSRQREIRVSQILRFLESTFDPHKISSGKPNTFTYDAGLSRWIRNEFPSGVSGKLLKGVDASLRLRSQSFRVPKAFVEHVVQIIVFCLNDPNVDSSLPTNRIKSLWNLFPSAPAWNQDYFRVVRNHLHKRKVIDIYDRNHGQFKAWKWRKGVCFPGKKTRNQSHFKVKTKVSLFQSKIKKKTSKIHNSLYGIADQKFPVTGLQPLERPPP